MKRIIKYTSIIAAIAVFASCNLESLTPLDEGNGDGLTVRLQTMSMETKAAVPGEGVENTVTHADFFFFSDSEGTDLIYKERLSVGSDVATSLVAKEGNIYEHKFGELTEGDAISGKTFVYVIANYPEEISATLGTTTLDDILSLDIKTDLSASPEYFVMDSYNSTDDTYVTALTPSKKADQGQYTIGLTRAAAKLVLKFNVAKSYTDDAENVWTPVTSQMWVNFVNARKAAIVKAEPVEFDEKGNYFNTAQETPKPATAAKTGYTSWEVSDVYTYPQSYLPSDVTAPYFKIFVPWTCEKKGQNNFYYKIILPELESFQRNKIYNLTVDVSCVGGTEEDWALVSDYIFVADWWAPDAIEATFEGALYLDVPVKEYTIYGINNITVPVVSSNNIRIVSCTGVQQTVRETITSVEDGGAHTKTVRAVSCTPSGNDSFTLTYNLDATVTASRNTSFDCTPIEWTVVVQHVQTTDPPSLSKTVPVKIKQYPSIYAKLIEGGNSFVNGYYSLQTASVTPTPNNQRSRTGDGSTWYYYRNNGTIVDDYTGNDNRVITGTSNGNSYGYMNNDYTRTSTMTYVTVSAFAPGSDSYTVVSNGDGTAAKTFEYIIGDPRINANYTSTSLYPYLNGNQTTQWGATEVASIKIGTDQQKNLIAPAFMVASERGGRPASVEGTLNFEGATKRCATYQEAGYPAGRWRLPTEAELYFLYSLQRMQVIDNLFNGGNGYWASSGNVFGEDNNYSFRAGNAGHQGNHSIRCIYDMWYWGETPEANVHTYYPGTKN